MSVHRITQHNRMNNRYDKESRSNKIVVYNPSVNRKGDNMNDIELLQWNREEEYREYIESIVHKVYKEGHT